MMANPQTENGFLKIANDLFEAIIRQKLASSELRIFLFVIRKTYGFKKTWDRISYSQLSEGTGITRNHINRVLKSLKQKKMIDSRAVLTRLTGNPYSIEYRIQKDYELWETGAKMLSSTIPSATNAGATAGGVKVPPKMVHTKDNTKDSINMSTPMVSSDVIKDTLKEKFELFWNKYPKKRSKVDSKTAWEKLNPNVILFHTILNDLDERRVSNEWSKENGQFIPLPAKYIRKQLWEDEKFSVAYQKPMRPEDLRV